MPTDPMSLKRYRSGVVSEHPSSASGDATHMAASEISTAIARLTQLAM